ncbi:MAG TPA: hypothetical protein V6C72_20035 [Chroococcales cyanobacterium]
MIKEMDSHCVSALAPLSDEDMQFMGRLRHSDRTAYTYLAAQARASGTGMSALTYGVKVAKTEAQMQTVGRMIIEGNPGRGLSSGRFLLQKVISNPEVVQPCLLSTWRSVTQSLLHG